MLKDQSYEVLHARSRWGHHVLHYAAANPTFGAKNWEMLMAKVEDNSPVCILLLMMQSYQRAPELTRTAVQDCMSASLLACLELALYVSLRLWVLADLQTTLFAICC